MSRLTYGFKIPTELRKNPEKRMELLMAAVIDGHAEKVKMLASLDTTLHRLVNTSDSHGQTPLHNAARFDQVESAIALFESGAALNIRNSSFDTPLHVACKYGSCKTAAALIHFGADTETQALLNKTPLHIAASEGSDTCVLLLLKNKANPFVRTAKDVDFGNTALHLAAWFGHLKCVDALLTPYLSPDLTPETLARLKERENCESNTALHLACCRGHLEVVRLLLEKGARIDSKGRHGRCPIHVAAAKGHVKVARLLLDHGTAIAVKSGANYPDFLQTPIHLAVFYGHAGVIELLVERDPRLLNMRSHLHGQTPLHRACANFQANCVELLIERGADVNKADFLGQTALMIAKHVKFDIATFRHAENRQRIIKMLTPQ